MADDYVIKILLQAVDKATGPLAAINKSLGLLKGAAIGLAGAWSLHKIIEVTSAAQESVVQLDVAFRNMGATAKVSRDEINALIKNIADNSTVSASEMRDATATLMRFASISGDMLKKAIGMSAEMAEAMGTDAASAAMKLGRALEDPAGSMGLLARSGVKFTQSEEAAIKKLVELNRAGDAQKIMLYALERRYKGVGEALRNTLGGAIGAVQKAMKGLAAQTIESTAPAVKSLNELTKALKTPGAKEEVDALIKLLIEMGTVIVKLGTIILGGGASFFEWMLDKWDILGQKIADGILKLKEYMRLNAANPETAATQGRRLDSVAAYFDPTMAPLPKGPSRRLTTTPEERAAQEKAKRLTDEAAKLASSDESAKAAKAIAEQRSSALSGVAKVVDEWKQSEDKIAAALAAGAISQAEATASLSDLNAEIRSTVLPESMTYGSDLQAQIDLVIAALDKGKISATEAGEAIKEFNRLAADEVGPSWMKAAHEWENAEKRIAAAVEAGILDAKLAKDAVKELQDQNLEEISVTAKRIKVELPPDPMADFRKKMAETLQSTFADAFDGIGEKSGTEVARDFLKAFKRIFAEAAALNLMKVLGIDQLAAGKVTTGTGVIGKIIGAIFPSPKAATGGRVPTDTGVDGGIVAGDSCISKCASEVVGTVTQTTATTMTKTLGDFFDGFMGYIKPIFSGLWKFLTGMLQKIWEFIKGALAAIRSMMTANTASSGGSGIWGAIVQGVAAYFTGGASLAGTAASATGNWSGPRASGGAVRGGRSYLVGEEGPEVFMPGMSGMIANGRQMAFGAGREMTFSPSYNIVINGARDDKEMMGQIAAYVRGQDEKTKAELYETLRRNGNGRMRR